MIHRLRRIGIALGLLAALALAQQPQSRAELAQAPPTASRDASEQTVKYTISLHDPARSLLRVKIDFPRGPGIRHIQIPAWNALYQIRDFAQYVRRWSARTADGRVLPARKIDKNTWEVAGGECCRMLVEYEVAAVLPGPFGAEVTQQHAFLNLAMVLMYALDTRDLPASLEFENIPTSWGLALALPPLSRESPKAGRARNYDELVDSPVELAHFREASFTGLGGRYRVIVHADPSDYDMDALVGVLKKIVTAAVEWMNDRPFDQYVFIYHFPKRSAGGGMEHAFSTAIDVSAENVRRNIRAVMDVSAHEFFHLWNVKRIRPQSLAKFDYTRENYTRALWFSEGVTSTVAAHILFRAGLLDEKQFLDELTAAINELHARPARVMQSVEQASLEAWLEKYPHYRVPERSISYYNKGEILGVMLDLAIRKGSGGRRSLRDLFHLLNTEYAKRGRFFDESRTLWQVAESLAGTDLTGFFEKYVSGVEEIPYDEFLETVGLRVERDAISVADTGFIVVRNFDGPAVVALVEPGSGAEEAGLKIGDVLELIDGSPPARDINQTFDSLRPGGEVRVRITRGTEQRDLKIRLGSKQIDRLRISDLSKVTQAHRSRRRAWFLGESEGGTQR
jgi:predicted metalloprotease with PDZ domain